MNAVFTKFAETIKNCMDASFHLSLPLTSKQLIAAIRQLPISERQLLFTSLLKDAVQEQEENTTVTHFASEKTLAKDWLTKEEDEAWQTL